MHFYPIRQLIKNLSAQWKLVVLLLLVFFVGAVVMALIPIAIQYLVDNTFIQKDWELVQKSLWVILVLSVARAIVNLICNQLTYTISSRFGANLHCKVASKLLGLPIHQLEDFMQQKQLNELFRNTIQINLVTIEKLSLLIKEFFILLGLCVSIIFLQPNFLLLSLLLTVAILSLNQIAHDQLNKLNQEWRISFNQLIRYPIKSIQHFKEITLYQGLLYESDRLGKSVASAFKQNQQKIMVKSVIRFLTEVLVMCIIIISFYLVTLEISHAESTIGEIIAFIVATVFLFLSIYTIKNGIARLKPDSAHLTNVFAFLDQSVEEDSGTQPLLAVQGKLHFDQVQLTHTSQPLTLNLTIQPSEKIVFTNYSITAKKQLIDLILRFQTPDSGKILLDDKLLTEIKPNDFYAHMAVIAQNSTLLDDTIAGNIAYGPLRYANEAQITTISQKSGVATFIAKMPQGFQTKVGEGGVAIQKSEHLHIAIARALLKKPAIIILDEVFDSEISNNETIMRAIKNLTADRTTLIFNQTLEGVIDYDRVISLDQTSNTANH